MVQEHEAGTVLAMRRVSVDVPVIMDPARYLQPTTNERTQHPSLWSADPLDAVAEGQAQHRVSAFLSPASYIASGDFLRLSAVLDEGLRFAEIANRQPHRAPVLIALPIDTGWLRRPEHREQLIKATSGIGIGMAVFPSGSGDPLEGRQAVAGLVRRLLESAKDGVAVLRTDLATRDRSDGLWRGGHLDRAVDGIATYRDGRRSRLRPAGQVAPSAGQAPPLAGLAALSSGTGRPGRAATQCDCPVCYGRSLRRFIREDANSMREAATHSVLVWRSIVGRILGRAA